MGKGKHSRRTDRDSSSVNIHGVPSKPRTIVRANYHHDRITRPHHYGCIILAFASAIQLISDSHAVTLRREVDVELGGDHTFIFAALSDGRQILNMDPSWASRSENYLYRVVSTISLRVHASSMYSSSPRFQLVLWALSLRTLRAAFFRLLAPKISYVLEKNPLIASELETMSPKDDENVLSDCFMAFIVCIWESSRDQAEKFLVRLLSPYIEEVYCSNLNTTFTSHRLPQSAFELHSGGLGNDNSRNYRRPTDSSVVEETPSLSRQGNKENDSTARSGPSGSRGVAKRRHQQQQPNSSSNRKRKLTIVQSSTSTAASPAHSENKKRRLEVNRPRPSSSRAQPLCSDQTGPSSYKRKLDDMVAPSHNASPGSTFTFTLPATDLDSGSDRKKRRMDIGSPRPPPSAQPRVPQIPGQPGAQMHQPEPPEPSTYRSQIPRSVARYGKKPPHTLPSSCHPQNLLGGYRG
ncbi:hypothetical protein ONZ45_g6267 [Pleurotus djamor]|nr:hypothetical protein ONZ45_g6267 [Pleurotus djamor]